MNDQHCPSNRANGLPGRPKHLRKYEVHQLGKVHNYAQFECNQGADRNKHTNKIMSVSVGKTARRYVVHAFAALSMLLQIKSHAIKSLSMNMGLLSESFDHFIHLDVKYE